MILPAADADFESLASSGRVQGRPVAGDGIAPAPVLKMLRDLAARIRPVCAPAAWWIVEDGEVVGLCSITAVPAGAVMDIGYGIAASRQGRGAATRAVADVLAWAANRADVEAVTAETSIANPASQRVLERNGFLKTGDRTDPEDGPLICWRAAVKP